MVESPRKDREDDRHDDLHFETITPSGSASVSPPSNDGSSSRIRSMLGHGTGQLSDFVNENKIAARYCVTATIGVLGAYAIAHSPIFFRYRTVSEIPSGLFRNRNYITGRLFVCNAIAARASNSGTVAVSGRQFEPITCYLRHLSPMERLLSKSALDRLFKLYPGSASSSRPEESPHELLQIQIAGIVYPDNSNDTPQSGESSRFGQQIALSYDTQEEVSAGKEWIRKLAEQRSLVRCQLLGRRVPHCGASSQLASRNKRPIPGLTSDESVFETSAGNEHAAVAKLFYRPKPMDLLPTDLGELMILKGFAVVSEDGLFPHTPAERVVDTTDAIKILQRDGAYMERLGRTEYQAARGSYGVWANPDYRTARADVVDEVNFQERASVFRKIWRWWRS